MQTILTKLTDEQAAKEVKQFTVLGLAFALVSLFALWFLAIPGLAFSGRGLLLTWHKANKGAAMKYRVMSIIGVLVSIVALVLVNLND